jgi:hypothetical protein
MMRRIQETTVVVMSVSLLVAAQSFGGILATDSNGIPGWQGTKTFNAIFMGYSMWSADVEYCVYAPGQFDETFGVEPNAGHYVYAYQITDVQDIMYPSSYVNLFTLGFSDKGQYDDIEQVANIGWLTYTTGEVAPTASEFNPPLPDVPGSAVWTFGQSGSDPVRIGDQSTILYYSSPFEPEWDSSTVAGAGGYYSTLDMPSPQGTPEPTMLVLLAFGGIFLVKKKKLRLRRYI